MMLSTELKAPFVLTLARGSAVGAGAAREMGNAATLSIAEALLCPFANPGRRPRVHRPRSSHRSSRRGAGGDRAQDPQWRSAVLLRRRPVLAPDRLEHP